MDIAQIAADDAARLADQGAYLLDVREDDEWTAGHAPSATHIRLAEIPARVGDIPGGRRIVAICRVGGRSQKAAEFLATQGIEAANLSGGMRAWAAAGFPVVTDDGGGGTVI